MAMENAEPHSISRTSLLFSKPRRGTICEAVAGRAYDEGVSQSTSQRRVRDDFRTHDEQLHPIAEKVFAGHRLSFEDGLTLYRSSDILAVGWLANRVRESLHGDITYFNVNRHINPTNVCVAACRLCAFGRKKDDAHAYTMALDEAWATAASGYHEAVTEFHIVGGLHPDLPLEYFLDLVRGLKERFPKVHIKAFTMVEVSFLARRAKLTIPEVLVKLKEAGVDSMPGGGAEIFSDRVRHIICDHKIDGDEWLETARAAHKLGLRSNATMLYGHVENDEDRVDHMLRLRAVQDDTGGFQTFIPLAFHPDNTPLQHLPRTTGLTDLRQIAVGRLLLDNFAHIKAYWQMMTAGIAQVALRFGADDIDGTVIEEKIYHDAGASTPQGMRRSDLIRLIREAGREPFERDTLYRAVTRTEDSFTVAV
jgi:aminodeoxyfutalosine synthase